MVAAATTVTATNLGPGLAQRHWSPVVPQTVLGMHVHVRPLGPLFCVPVAYPPVVLSHVRSIDPLDFTYKTLIYFKG